MLFRSKVSEAIERLKVTVVSSPTPEEDPVAGGVREPVVTFVEPDQTPEAETIEIEPTPSEQSVSVMSDVTDITKPADRELTSGRHILRRWTSSVLSAPFVVLSQTTFKSLTRTMCKTLLLQLHLVLGH